ncbi:MAG: RIP metalloprotease RseP [Firmicutes bacterium]|nr:RIP metalloprotease RseP [Bacillota bacterium]
MASTVITAVASVIIFTLMVFSHEFGHFIAAKKAGVMVEEFSIGMGPKVTSWKRKETKYSLRIFPIGGYVKMLGEEDKAEVEGSFHKKSLGRRMSIILAGPIMNIILAILLFSIIFFVIGTPTTVINTVMEGYPADASGIQPGDRVEYIDGERVESWERLQYLVSASKGEQMEVSVNRMGQRIMLNVFPVTDPDTGQRIIGITPTSQKDPLGSLRLGVTRSFEVIGLMVTYLGQLVTGRASAEDVVGAVGVIQLVNQAAKTGILNVMFLAAFLSLNLGVINLLPIPALDGGKMVFLLVEGVRGKPIDIEKEGFIHFIGFVFLILLIIVITWKDISRFNLF